MQMWGQSLLLEVLFQVIVCTLGAFLILVLYLAAVLGNGFNIIAISLGFLSGLIDRYRGYYHQSKDVLKSQNQQLPADVRQKQQDFPNFFKDPSQGTRLLSKSNTCQEVSVPEVGDASVQDMTSCIKQPKKDDDQADKNQQQLSVDVRPEQQVSSDDEDISEDIRFLNEGIPIPGVLEHKSTDTLHHDRTSCLKQASKVNDNHARSLPVDVLEYESNDTLVQDSISYINPINVDDDHIDDHVDENQQLPIDVEHSSVEPYLFSDRNTSSEILELEENNVVQDMISEEYTRNVEDDHVDENQQIPVDVKYEGTQLFNEIYTFLEHERNVALVHDMTSIKPLIKNDDDHLDENQQHLPVDVRKEQEFLVEESSEITQLPHEIITSPELLEHESNDASVQDTTSCIKKTINVDNDQVGENQHQLPVDVEYYSGETQLLREIDTSEVSEFEHNNALVQNMTSCDEQPINVIDDHVDENLSLPVVVEYFSEETQLLREIDTSEVSEFEHNNALVQNIISCEEQHINVEDDHVDENLSLPGGVEDFSEETQLLREIDTSEVSEFEHNNALVQNIISCEEQQINVEDDHVDENLSIPVGVEDPSEETQLLREIDTSEFSEFEHNNALVQNITSCEEQQINVEDDHVDENLSIPVGVEDPSQETQLLREIDTFEFSEFEHNNALVQNMTSCEEQPINVIDNHVDKNLSLPVVVEYFSEETQLLREIDTSEISEIEYNNALVQNISSCEAQQINVEDDHVDENLSLPGGVEDFSEETKLLREIDTSEVSEIEHNNAFVQNTTCEEQPINGKDNHVDESLSLPVGVENYSEETQLLREIDTSEVSEFEHNNAFVQNMTSCKEQPINVKDNHVDENLSLPDGVEDFSEETQPLCEIDTSEVSEFAHNTALVQNITSCEEQQINVEDDHVDKNLSIPVGVEDASEETQLLREIDTSDISEIEHNNAFVQNTTCEEQPINVKDNHVDESLSLPVGVENYSEETQLLREIDTSEVSEFKHNNAFVQNMTSCKEQPINVKDNRVDENLSLPDGVEDFSEETQPLCEIDTSEVSEFAHNTALVQNITSCEEQQINVEDDHVDENLSIPVGVEDFSEKTQLLRKIDTSEVSEFEHNNAFAQNMTSCEEQPINVKDAHVDKNLLLPVVVEDFSEETQLLREIDPSEVSEFEHNNALVQNMTSCEEQPMNVIDNHVDENLSLPVVVEYFSEETQLQREIDTSDISEIEHNNALVQNITSCEEQQINVEDDHVDKNLSIPVGVEDASEETQLLREIDTSEVSEFEHNNALVQNGTSCEEQPINVNDDYVDENLSLPVVVEDFSEETQLLREIDTSEVSEFEHNNALVQNIISCEEQQINVEDDHVDENLSLPGGVEDFSEETQLLREIDTSEVSEFEHNNALVQNIISCEEQQINVEDDHVDKNLSLPVVVEDFSEETKLLREIDTSEVSEFEHNNAFIQNTTCEEQPINIKDKHVNESLSLPVVVEYFSEETQLLREIDTSEISEIEHNNALVQNIPSCEEQQINVEDDHVDKNLSIHVGVEDASEETQLLREIDTSEVSEFEHNNALVQNIISCEEQQINVEDDHVDENLSLPGGVEDFSEETQLLREIDTSEVSEFKHNNALVQNIISCEEQQINVEDDHVDKNLSLPVVVEDFSEETKLLREIDTSEVSEFEHNNAFIQNTTCEEQPINIKDKHVNESLSLPVVVEYFSMETQLLREIDTSEISEIEHNNALVQNITSCEEQQINVEDDHVDKNLSIPVGVEDASEETQLLREIDTSEVSEFEHNNALVQNRTSCEEQPINVNDDYVDKNLSLPVVVEDFSEETQLLREIDTSEVSEFEHNNALVQNIISCEEQQINVEDDHVDENLSLPGGVEGFSEETQLLREIDTSEVSEFEHNNALVQNIISCEEQQINVEDDHVDENLSIPGGVEDFSEETKLLREIDTSEVSEFEHNNAFVQNTTCEEQPINVKDKQVDESLSLPVGVEDYSEETQLLREIDTSEVSEFEHNNALVQDMTSYKKQLMNVGHEFVDKNLQLSVGVKDSSEKTQLLSEIGTSEFSEFEHNNALGRDMKSRENQPMNVDDDHVDDDHVDDEHVDANLQLSIGVEAFLEKPQLLSKIDTSEISEFEQNNALVQGITSCIKQSIKFDEDHIDNQKKEERKSKKKCKKMRRRRRRRRRKRR